jgi:hypothetical protein
MHGVLLQADITDKYFSRERDKHLDRENNTRPTPEEMYSTL